WQQACAARSFRRNRPRSITSSTPTDEQGGQIVGRIGLRSGQPPTLQQSAVGCILGPAALATLPALPDSAGRTAVQISAGGLAGGTSWHGSSGSRATSRGSRAPCARSG